MTRSEQQHNNKPQRKRSQGSVSPVRAPGLPGTLVWDAQTPPKPPGKRIPPLEPQGKGRTPQKSLSQRDSRCHPSPSLPRSRAALPRDHFLGNTCRGRCRCSLTALSTGSHRTGIPRGTGAPPAPLKRGTNRLANTTPSTDVLPPIPEGPWGRSCPGRARPGGSRPPPAGQLRTEPLTPGAPSGTGGRGGSTSDA